MADPIQVEVTRGDVVEALHTVHAVAVRDGQIVAEAGDAQLRHLPPLVGEAAPGAAARARAARPRRPGDRDRVRVALGTAGAARRGARAARRRPRDRGRPRDRPRPDAARAQLLRQARGLPRRLPARGLETHGYRLGDASAAARSCSREVAAAAEVDPDSMPVGDRRLWRADVRSAPRPLRPRLRSSCLGSTAARGLSRRCAPTRRCCAGPSRPMRAFIRALPGWAAKGGAEGLFCACSTDGLGIALKVEDGAFRAIRPALAAFCASSASTPASSASSPWKTAAASPSGRFGRG